MSLIIFWFLFWPSCYYIFFACTYFCGYGAQQALLLKQALHQNKFVLTFHSKNKGFIETSKLKTKKLCLWNNFFSPILYVFFFIRFSFLHSIYFAIDTHRKFSYNAVCCVCIYLVLVAFFISFFINSIHVHTINIGV